MTEYVIEMYDTFHTKGCLDEIFFGNFHDQPIPPGYYDFLNDNNDNNTPVATVDDVFPDNEGVEDAVIPNAPNAYDNDK